MLYDLLSNLAMEVIIAQCAIGENTLMGTMIDHANLPSSIFLLDRGFEASPIEVRVTRITLNTSEVELLVSSLFDTDLVNEKDIQTLYAMRRGVEEGFKKMQPKMKLEQLGYKKHYWVCQEFFAHIFMMNLVSLLGD